MSYFDPRLMAAKWLALGGHPATEIAFKCHMQMRDANKIIAEVNATRADNQNQELGHEMVSTLPRVPRHRQRAG